MAIEPPIFALAARQPAPQQGPPLGWVGEAAERQRQGKAHGRRLVAIGAGRHVMQPGAGQALGRQMRVDAGKTRGPGGAPAAPPIKAHLALLQPVDMAAQGLHQRQNLIFPAVFGNGKAPAPRVRRFHDA